MNPYIYSSIVALNLFIVIQVNAPYHRSMLQDIPVSKVIVNATEQRRLLKKLIAQKNKVIYSFSDVVQKCKAI